MEEKSIIEIFKDLDIYTRRIDAIRELLKNSYDACKFKKDIEKISDLTYIPKIDLNFDTKERILIINDNGVGMDQRIIREYFEKLEEVFINLVNLMKITIILFL